jgi:hypothetical protein
MEGRGLQSGHWRLKGAATVPSEEEIRKMVTPEQVCMYETMSAALRQLEDLGYAVGDETKKSSVMANSNRDDVQMEEEMAPWKLTKNFSMAIQHKLFLKLEGLGDPSGCGEGFSFLRAGPREKFGKFTGGDTRFSSQDQQASYHHTIHEIWDKQLQSLSNVEPPFAPIEQVILSQDHERIKRQKELQRRTQSLKGKDNDKAYAAAPDSDGDSEFRRITGPDGNPIIGKALVIRRRLKGMKEWQEELVRDPKIIAAYLKLKQQLANAGEGSALDKFRRQKLMSEARAIRENQIQEVLRNSREVRCRRCGQIGHIKTNREKCPAWRQEEKAKLVKRRKKDIDETEIFRTPKRTKRRHADVDLSEIFDSILLGVTSMPEAKQFMSPLSVKGHPEFYSKVKDPKFLNQILESNKSLMYKSADDFVNDIRLIHSNSVEAYGYEHPYTAASGHIKSFVVREINQRVERLRELEEEIVSTTRLKKGRPSMRRGTPKEKKSAVRANPPILSVPIDQLNNHSPTTSVNSQVRDSGQERRSSYHIDSSDREIANPSHGPVSTFGVAKEGVSAMDEDEDIDVESL